MTLCRKSWAEMIANDPMLLLSFVNTRLRDECESIDELCAMLDMSRADLEGRLATIGYTYDKRINQFI